MPTFDQSTHLANRAIVAATLGPPTAPDEVTLPGAKAAIPHDRLCAYQDAGIGHDEIVARTNARWEADNAATLAAHAEWAGGPYRDAIVEAQQQAFQAAAENLRRQAILEQMLQEWEGE